MPLTFDEAHYINSLIGIDYPESRIDAVNWIIQEIIGPEKLASKLHGKKECSDVATACDVLRALLKIELETENYLIGATLCWGTTLFDSRPHSVRLIWSRLQTYPQLLIFGAGAGGKSYSVIAFKLLDWERDPEFTTIKIASTTAGHERANTFSNLVRLHRNSAVPLSGYIRQGFIGLDKDDRRSSISEVTIDKGDENKSGKIQGFHPLPRPYPHPKFGTLSRVSGVFDEVEDIAVGLWKGEANMMLNMDDEMHVSIVAMWNPKDKSSMAAQKSEPEGGWANLDESLDEYISRAGYHCIRLDARKFENVIQKKLIYAGFQTWEGYKRLEEKGGAELATFGHGIYPTEIASFGIVDPIQLDRSRGTFVWQRTPTNVASLDMAEEGLDIAEFTSARYGQAIAFEPDLGEEKIRTAIQNPEFRKQLQIKYSKYGTIFADRSIGVRFNFPKPRLVVQFDQQFPLQKKNTILMGQDAIEMNQLLHVRPEWFGLDCTSTVNLRDWLWLKWGKIIGIKWGEGATEIPILNEVREMPSESYANIKTEMFFAFSAWVEFGYVAFSPSMDTSELFNELSGMRYKNVGKVMKRCEDTKEFKKRFGGKSPDRAASAIQIIHVIRRNASQVQRPAMEPTMNQQKGYVEEYAQSGDEGFKETVDVSDQIDWIK